MYINIYMYIYIYVWRFVNMTSPPNPNSFDPVQAIFAICCEANLSRSYLLNPESIWIIYIYLLALTCPLNGQIVKWIGSVRGIHTAFRGVTGVAWNHYKIRVNRALRLLGTSCTHFGRLRVDFGLTWGRPGRSFGPPWSSWGCLGRHFSILGRFREFHPYIYIYIYIY